jgi:UBX domain
LVQANLQANEVSATELTQRLKTLFDSPDQSSSTEHISPEASERPRDLPISKNDTDGEPESSATNLGYLDLQPSSGRFRLPNNAYDALRAHTHSLLAKGEAPRQILESQLTVLERLPIFRDEVKQMRLQSSPVLSETILDRLLRLPAAAIKAQPKTEVSTSTTPNSSAGRSVYNNDTTSNHNTITSRARDTSTQHSPPPPPLPVDGESQSSEPPTYSSSQHQTQRSDYIRIQKQREQAQKDERTRIKAQIKADREERRLKEQMLKQNETATVAAVSESVPTKPKTTDVRIQVRTFDGSTLRTTLSPKSTITADVRPWIDQSADNNLPYNLKIILTPLPNKNIEASEEEYSLSDLGIKGSCTLVMVPVKGYVESYSGSTPTGLVGSAVSNGYNLVTGTVGGIFGGVRSMLGYGRQPQQDPQVDTTAVESRSGQTAGQSQRNVKVRTLADQRREDRGRDQQFYNGNALNFTPNRDDDDGTRKED